MQNKQVLIDKAIIDALVSSIPCTWNSAILVITRPKHDSPVGDLLHSIESPEGYSPVAPDMSLFDATYRLDALFYENGAVLKKAIYHVELQENSHHWNAEFIKY